MSGLVSCDLTYTKFRDTINTLRYQHAVMYGGQQLLHLVLRTFIQGDIDNVEGCVREALKGSNTQFKNSFTKNEKKLLKGDHTSWDINLLFKAIQKVCGLGPLDNETLTLSNSDDGPLESFIITLKKLRDELAHNFGVETSDDKLTSLLNQFSTRAFNMLLAIQERAQQQGNQMSEDEVNVTMNMINDIISNVKEKINEGVPSSENLPRGVPESVSGNDGDEYDEYEEDPLQYDSPYAAASAAGGYTLQDQDWKILFESLKREFWKFAGSNDDNNYEYDSE